MIIIQEGILGSAWRGLSMVVRKLLEFREFIPCFVQPMTMTARNKVYKGQHIAQQTTQANMAMPTEGKMHD